jgi:hypothetical protein
VTPSRTAAAIRSAIAFVTTANPIRTSRRTSGAYGVLRPLRQGGRTPRPRELAAAF